MLVKRSRQLLFYPVEHTPYILVTLIWKEVTSKVDFRNSFFAFCIGK
ncbi:hypothetical protein BOVA514_4295 [Bacteroides ovatus]|nr:hypothetical protein BOVA514_4295 [Bacteroides ovatus]